MENRDERIRELETNVEKALEELAETSSKHDPDSRAVREAKEKRALEEKALFDFLDEGKS